MNFNVADYADSTSEIGDFERSVSDSTTKTPDGGAATSCKSPKKQRKNQKRREQYRRMSNYEKDKHNAQSKLNMRNYRARKKQKHFAEMRTLLTSNRIQQAYAKPSSLTRAVNKLEEQLPPDEARRKAVLIAFAQRHKLIPVLVTARPARRISPEIAELVKGFFFDDDVSTQAVGQQSTVKIAGTLVTKRYLSTSLAECHQLFCEKYGVQISFSKFASLRPGEISCFGST